MPSTVNLLCVDPPLVASIWPHVRALVKSAVDRAEGDFGHIECEVLSGMQQLWLASDGKTIEAAAVTQLVFIGGRKTCVIVACGGRGDWVRLINGLEDFAKAEGCTRTRIIGRKGWLRVLKQYRAKYVTMDKELA